MYKHNTSCEALHAVLIHAHCTTAKVISLSGTEQ